MIPAFWVMTAGMMMVHLASALLGVTSIFLLLLGIFVPPIGIVNALLFLFSGESLNAYF